MGMPRKVALILRTTHHFLFDGLLLFLDLGQTGRWVNTRTLSLHNGQFGRILRRLCTEDVI